jgi:hypothetical protein
MNLDTLWVQGQLLIVVMIVLTSLFVKHISVTAPWQIVNEIRRLLQATHSRGRAE